MRNFFLNVGSDSFCVALQIPGVWTKSRPNLSMDFVSRVNDEWTSMCVIAQVQNVPGICISLWLKPALLPGIRLEDRWMQEVHIQIQSWESMNAWHWSAYISA